MSERCGASVSDPDSLDDAAPERTRTYTWEDPMRLAEAGRRMSGIVFFRAILAGELPPPPIAQTLGFRFAEVEEGRVVFTGTPAEYLYNPIGVAHGGFAATLLDSAMGCAVHSVLPAGVAYTTLEIKVNYVRAITAQTGELRAEGTVIHIGGRTATAEGRITDAAGTLYAHGTTTCLVLRP